MAISGELVAFLILALIAIIGGVLMINLTKVMHMMLSLVFTFLAIAGIYVLLNAEFVAVVQILIYSGALTIIMLFGIMLTKHKDKTVGKVSMRRNVVVLVSIIAFFIIVYFAISGIHFPEQATDLHVENTKQLGIALYSHYVIPFELTSVVLLVALIGAIILAKRDDEEEEVHTNE